MAFETLDDLDPDDWSEDDEADLREFESKHIVS